MNKIDWKSKLTSRKFWAAVIGFVTAILVACNVDDMTIQQVVAVVSGASVLIAYIIGEGLVDASRSSAATVSESFEAPDATQITFTPASFLNAVSGGSDEQAD